MKVLGIIIEANPFHNGHKYFIDQAISTIKPDCTIAISSTSFTMRGEISLLNKFVKTNVLLNNSVDIVMELPFSQAVQSADYFCEYSIRNLSKMGVTDIAFGCEIDDINLLNKFVSIITSNDFASKLKEEKSFSSSLKDSFTSILKEFLTNKEIEIFNKPNTTLAIQYLKAIKKFNLNITPHIIKRINSNYHDKSINGEIASATAIRNSILNNIDYKNTISHEVYDNLINIKKTNDNYVKMLQYKYLVEQPLKNIFNDNEGINNYILNNGDFSNLTNFQNSLKNKRYTINRINRINLFTLLNISEIPNYTPYLRILGINKKGLNYINSLPKETKELIFITPKECKKFNKEIQDTLYIEIQATKLYGVLTNNIELQNYENKLPIRKD